MKEYCRTCMMFTRHDRIGRCRYCLSKGNPLRVGLIIAFCMLITVVMIARYWFNAH